MMVDENTAPVINTLSVTKNGTYTAPDGVDGYSPITVDVQEEPWEPLQDGYSNFWFELTNDTLSPWLNFSAKTNDAVIDWGDGSGEVALDTLTPTHTYSKAGKYVVKVKGVTGIGRQHTSPYQGEYLCCLKHIEFNSEITNVTDYAFSLCVGLKEITLNSGITLGGSAFSRCSNLSKVITNITDIPNNTFYGCTSLSNLQIGSGTTYIRRYVLYECFSLQEVIIPSSTTTMASGIFENCSSLSEIHIQATTPPTIGTDVFKNIRPNYIIYVPVGYGETYKAASGWSSYADHILEEGSTPNRAMLAKFNDKSDDKSDTPEER